MLKPTTTGKAFFAVKKRSPDAKCAPTLVAIVSSYDEAILVADRHNKRAEPLYEPYYASVQYYG